MTSIKEHVVRYRQSLRAVILLGVLLLCVAVAHLLVDYKSADAAEGASILAEIRQKGMQQYLPATKSENYYIITAAGSPMGWKLVYTRTTKKGGYSGGCIMLRNTAPDSVEISASQWELNKNATAGKYFSHVFLKDALPQEVYTTEILLKDGKVTLSQSIGGKVIEANSKKPANYIPEDLTQVAMFELVKKKKNACFRTIYDVIPSDDSAVPFITLKCRYDGEAEGLSRLAVRSSVDDSSMEDSVLCFDKSGKVVKMISPDGEVESLSDLKALEKAFPNSAKLIKMLTTETSSGQVP